MKLLANIEVWEWIVILSHTLLSMWSLIQAGIKLNHVNKGTNEHFDYISNRCYIFAARRTIIFRLVDAINLNLQIYFTYYISMDKSPLLLGVAVVTLTGVTPAVISF